MLGTLGTPADGPAVGANGIGSDVVDRLRASLTPGSSAVIAVLNDRWVPKRQRELESARARALMLTRITQGSVGVVRITGSAMAAGSTGRPATAPSAQPDPPASSP
jgi:hypothetical protein